MGVKARGVALAVAVWLMVVAGASALAWLAINNAGRVAVSRATGSGNAVPSATGTAPSRPSSPTPPPAQVTPRGTPQGQVDRATEVVGGHVGVRCVGGRIALRFAQPENGWSVEVGSSGPVEVQVTFKRTGAPGGQTQSTAGCERGTPAFSQESDSDAVSSDG